MVRDAKSRKTRPKLLGGKTGGQDDKRGRRQVRVTNFSLNGMSLHPRDTESHTMCVKKGRQLAGLYSMPGTFHAHVLQERVQPAVTNAYI